MKYLIIVLFTLSMFSCATRKGKIERAKGKIQRLTTKYPELLTNFSDTVIVPEIITDTIITEEHDTTVVNIVSNDTVTIETERAIVKYRIIKDSVYLNLNVKPDTIVRIDTLYKEIIKEVGIINTEKDCFHCVKKYAMYIFVIIIILLLLYVGIKILLRNGTII